MTQVTYSVKYRPNRLFAKWTRVCGLIGDGFVGGHLTRYFTKLTGEMIYIPSDSEVFFSKERSISIEQSVKREAGQ